MAEDGGGNSGSGGGDDDGGGNSGPGGGNDDDQNKDADEDDDGGKPPKAGQAGGGKVKLSDVLKAVRKRYPGEVVSVKLVKGEAGPVFRVKIIDASGRLLTLSVDGRSRRILKVSGG